MHVQLHDLLIDELTHKLKKEELDELEALDICTDMSYDDEMFVNQFNIEEEY